MELWIRNQNKITFQKVDNLLISDGDNVEGTFNIYTNSLPAQNVLGRYKTKERALEVLDEIQNFMRNYACAIKTNRRGEEIDLIPKPILIYNMPKK